MERKYFIDNLRILLTCLVVLHHLAISYGGPGLWYYNEANLDPIATILLSLFVATNQAFFMGMFFMISAYFLEKSLLKKAPSTLIKDRLKRLGIPLLFYALIISPIIMYLLSRFVDAKELSFFEFIQTENWFGFGPLWFVEALLIFTLIATLYVKVKGNLSNAKKRKLPTNQMIIGFTFLIALITYIVRIWLPVGWKLDPFGFQIAHFPQYISLFFIGFVASHNQWFSQITFSRAKGWLIFVAVMVFIIFPLIFFLGGASTQGPEMFMGGLNLQSLSYCLWEQFVGIGIMIGLIGVFKQKYNSQSKRLQSMSASAYTVYIIHALILVAISISIKDLAISPSLKFLILSPVVLIVCFMLANGIRKLPLARKIL